MQFYKNAQKACKRRIQRYPRGISDQSIPLLDEARRTRAVDLQVQKPVYFSGVGCKQMVVLIGKGSNKARVYGAAKNPHSN